jgi:type IV secretion system protein VirD4
MQGTNVLFGQIAVVFGIVIAGVWGATQWTAAALGYQVRLGSPWFDFSWHVDLPPVEAV